MTDDELRIESATAAGRFFPFAIFLHRQENGLIAPSDQEGFIFTSGEYSEIRRRLDKFYELVPDDDIQDYNSTKSDKLSTRYEKQKPKPVPGYIYVVRSGEYYKVGRTSNLEQRMKTFRTTLPAGTELVFTIKVSDTRSAETEIHTSLNESRINGEWFNLSESDIEYLMEYPGITDE